jgi:hypothetical protein
VNVLVKILYWLAVLVVSLALLVALVLFFESRDQSQVDNGSLLGPLLLIWRLLRA